jgi:hypothetical protein
MALSAACLALLPASICGPARNEHPALPQRCHYHPSSSRAQPAPPPPCLKRPKPRPCSAAVIIFGATGTVGHALVKMIKEGHLGMKDLKVIPGWWGGVGLGWGAVGWGGVVGSAEISSHPSSPPAHR